MSDGCQIGRQSVEKGALMDSVGGRCLRWQALVSKSFKTNLFTISHDLTNSQRQIWVGPAPSEKIVLPQEVQKGHVFEYEPMDRTHKC